MEAKTLTLKDGTIAYDEMGSGPLVVCVPGMGDTRGEYRVFAPALADAGYRVATMDLRGHGESSANWPDYSVREVGSDILALIRSLDAGPAVIVGNSMAAGAAIWTAAEEPEWVSALVLLGPATRGATTGVNRLLYSMLFTRPWGAAAWVKYYETLFTSRKPDDLAEHMAGLRRMLDEPGRLAALRQTMVELDFRDASEARMARVSAPTLVLMGSRDPDFTDQQAEARFVAESLRGTYQMVEGAGHYPQTERPDITIPAVLSFLQSLPLKEIASHAA